MNNETRVTCLAKIEVIPNKKNELLSALSHVKKESKKEEGCIEYQVLLDKNEPNSIVLFEVYKSKKHFDKHFQTEHIKWFMEEVRSKTCAKLYHDLYENADSKS